MTQHTAPTLNLIGAGHLGRTLAHLWHIHSIYTVQAVHTRSTASAQAAVAEIGGCFAFWAWWRLDRSPLWLLPGVAALVLFAWLLTLSEAHATGRTYAAYGGVYIAASLAWLWAVEGVSPDRWDVTGAAVCLIGATLIIAGPR